MFALFPNVEELGGICPFLLQLFTPLLCERSHRALEPTLWVVCGILALAAGFTPYQEEEDKTPGPQRCEGRGRPACLVAAGLPSGRGWQTRLQRLSPSPVPVSWGAGGRAPGSSCPTTALPPPRPSGWRWEWGFLSTSLSLHVPESLQTPSQGTEGRAGLT